MRLRLCLNRLVPFGDQLGDLLVLVLEQTESKSDIVPLTLAFHAGQPGCKLVGQLFGVLVLFGLSVTDLANPTNPQHTFSMNVAKNLMIFLN